MENGLKFALDYKKYLSFTEAEMSSNGSGETHINETIRLSMMSPYFRAVRR